MLGSRADRRKALCQRKASREASLLPRFGALLPEAQGRPARGSGPGRSGQKTPLSRSRWRFLLCGLAELGNPGSLALPPRRHTRLCPLLAAVQLELEPLTRAGVAKAHRGPATSGSPRRAPDSSAAMLGLLAGLPFMPQPHGGGWLCGLGQAQRGRLSHH